MDVGQGWWLSLISHLMTFLFLPSCVPEFRGGCYPLFPWKLQEGRKPCWKRGGCTRTPSILLILANKPQVLMFFWFSA